MSVLASLFANQSSVRTICNIVFREQLLREVLLCLCVGVVVASHSH